MLWSQATRTLACCQARREQESLACAFRISLVPLWSKNSRVICSDSPENGVKKAHVCISCGLQLCSIAGLLLCSTPLG